MNNANNPTTTAATTAAATPATATPTTTDLWSWAQQRFARVREAFRRHPDPVVREAGSFWAAEADLLVGRVRGDRRTAIAAARAFDAHCRNALDLLGKR
jgi:hypothetical protein